VIERVRGCASESSGASLAAGLYRSLRQDRMATVETVDR
jgi:hypothetical protein